MDFVCGTFIKDTPTSQVGLRLEHVEDRVIIHSIREGTLAAPTDLGSGMAIRLVNNVNCVGKDDLFVAQLMSSAVGTVTVVAEIPNASVELLLADRDLVSATVVVEEEGVNLGLVLLEAEDRLEITYIKPGGLAAGTNLKVGMEIYSINNNAVAGKTSSGASGIVLQTKGTNTILAFKREEKTMAKAPAERQIVAVQVEKPAGAQLGLLLSELNGKLIVDNVDKDGFLARKELHVGMEIFSINGTEVAGKSVSEAAKLLVDASALTIMAVKEKVNKGAAKPPAAKPAAKPSAAKQTVPAKPKGNKPSQKDAASKPGKNKKGKRLFGLFKFKK